MGARVNLQEGDVLIVVDVQNDFVAGGALAVPGGNDVIAPLNNCIRAFRSKQLPIIATRDWHPENHGSFEAQGGPWPPHCVQGSRGAQFVADLMLPAHIAVISSGTQVEREGYSGFQDTELHRHLQDIGAKRLFVGGLATDYCVLATVRDGLALSYQVFLVLDAVRAVNVHADDGAKAVAEMGRLGAVTMHSSELQDLGLDTTA
jgi:nicotinamidase/pyrazinamidase